MAKRITDLEKDTNGTFEWIIDQMSGANMIGESRPLEDYEAEAWDDYERVLDTIPNGRMYDRVSVHKAFPELQAAFDRAVSMGTFFRLKKGINE